MISKKAIKAFLARKGNDYRWLKKCKLWELDEAIDELGPKPKTKYKLRFHQKVLLIIMTEVHRFMLILDMGLGKTFIVLWILAYRKKCGERPLAIVFVPYVTGCDTWIKETRKHTPSLRCVPLLGNSDENLETLTTVDADLFVMAYQSGIAMVRDETEYYDKAKRKWRTKWNLTPKFVRKAFEDFDTLIIDECHKLMKHTSLYYRMCRAISTDVEYVYALTGTPFGKTPLALWAQFHVVDLGETFGPSIGLFRGSFFKETDGWFGGTNYTFIKKLKKPLNKMMQNSSLSYMQDECFDLPKKVEIIENVSFPKEFMTYYNTAIGEMRDFARSKKKDYHQIKSTYIQLCQISSGFMTFSAEGERERVKIEFKDNPKLEKLMSIIESIPPDRKVVVFHNFVHSSFIISDALKKAKIKHARIWSGQKKPLEELDRFENDKNCTVLVLNSKSGSSSLNLQHGNYVIFFELPMDVIDFWQAIKRVWRPGQLRRVFVYFILMRETADVKRLQYLRANEDLFQAVVDGREQLWK